MTSEATDIKTLSIVIPVYNELNTWRQLLERVQSVELPGLARQIVLVEDGSKDGTRQQLQQFAGDLPQTPPPGRSGPISYKVIFHPRNAGKGAALRSGFDAADGDVVIVQDADLEYDPNDYMAVIGPILAGEADVVFGSRFLNGRPEKAPRLNYLANRVLTWLSNRTTGLGLTDMETCYKAFRRDVLRRINIEQNRFGFEPEVTAKAAALKVRLVERPISYVGRSKHEGKKIGWKDGFKAVWCILKYRP